MPRKILTDIVPQAEEEDTRPTVGFFGKLPSTGDFVARGLPNTFRGKWDAWITRHVVPLQRDGLAFPDGGLRFQLVSGGRVAAGMILPSADSVGRLFPLSVMLMANGGLARPQIDTWCDAALALLTVDMTPDALWQALHDLPTPGPAETPREPMQVWTTTLPPATLAPEDTIQAIRQFLAGPRTNNLSSL